MAASPETRVIERLLEALGRDAQVVAGPRIGSTTLRAALRRITSLTKNQTRLHIPHYWAVYFHDGHGRFRARRGKFLVYFNNPADDPRFEGSSTPERARQVRRLTRQEYFRGLRINRERGSRGQAPFMFVIRSAGPQAGTFFFENDKGMRQFVDRAGGVGLAVFDRFVQQELVITDEQTATFTFRA